MHYNKQKQNDRGSGGSGDYRRDNGSRKFINANNGPQHSPRDENTYRGRESRDFQRGRNGGEDVANGYRGRNGEDGGNGYRGRNSGDGNGYRGAAGGGNGFVRGRGRGGGDRGGQKPPERIPVLTGEGAIFPVIVEPGKKAYRYDVSMIFKTPKFGGGTTMISLTTQKRDTRMRSLCYSLLSIVMEDTNYFGVDGIQVAYDNQNTLLSSHPFAPILCRVKKRRLPAELQPLIKSDNDISVKISPNLEMEHVDLSDLSQYKRDDILLDEDQTLRQLLEIILSQGAIDNNSYDCIGNGQLYRFDEVSLGRGLCVRYGTQKGIRIVEVEAENDASPKKICPALIVDFKCSPFYSIGKNLLEKVNEFVEGDARNPAVWETASKFYNGVRVFPVYDPHRVLSIKSFDEQNVDQITITIEGESPMTLPEFFRTKKDCKLQFPRTRAVNTDGGQFPMELLKILVNQRTDLDKTTPYLRDKVHGMNAVDPQKRYEKIMNEVTNMGLNNDITAAFGIAVSFEAVKRATELEFERPSKPSIIAGGNNIIQPFDDGHFDLGRNRYFQPCTIHRWVILYGKECDPQMVKSFMETFMNACRTRGITFDDGNASIMQFNSGTACFEEWRKTFGKLNKDNTSFVMLIDSKATSHSHNTLKLMESVEKILTQHVSYEIVKKIVELSQRRTLDNILHKINVKNGGINYKVQFNAADRLDINKGDVLVIGYDVAHPGGIIPEERKENMDATRITPSVVGITANVLSDPSIFIGDFFYQQPGQERVDGGALTSNIKQFLARLKENRKKLPSIVVILRDGLSEGQVKMAMFEELPHIRKGFEDFDANYKPEFVFIICTKRHHKRFFEGANGQFANPQAGSFLENKFTRPDIFEFYMQCHKAIKGTAKFVQVSVVLNEPLVCKKELFNFLHSLSYGHQIVCSPVSLPTPVFSADDLADRGLNLYHSVKQHMYEEIKWKNGEIDYAELSKLLNYSDTVLGNRRFNA